MCQKTQSPVWSYSFCFYKELEGLKFEGGKKVSWFHSLFFHFSFQTFFFIIIFFHFDTLHFPGGKNLRGKTKDMNKHWTMLLRVELRHVSVIFALQIHSIGGTMELSTSNDHFDVLSLIQHRKDQDWPNWRQFSFFWCISVCLWSSLTPCWQNWDYTLKRIPSISVTQLIWFSLHSLLDQRNKVNQFFKCHFG